MWSPPDSTALPGLWIPTVAFKQRDWWFIMAAVPRASVTTTLWKQSGSSLKAGHGHQPTASPDTPARSSSGFCGMT